MRPVSSRLRVFVSRGLGRKERGTKAGAFSGIAEVLGNRSSELVSSSATWTRFPWASQGKGRRGIRLPRRGREGVAEGACHYDVAAMAGTLKPHTDDSWPHATCLDTPGILMIPRLKEAKIARRFRKMSALVVRDIVDFVSVCQNKNILFLQENLLLRSSQSNSRVL